MSSSSPAWLVALGLLSTSVPPLLLLLLLLEEAEPVEQEEVEEVMEEGEEGEGVVAGVGGMREDWEGKMVRGRGVMVEVVVVVTGSGLLLGSSQVMTGVYVMTVTGEDTDTGGGGAVVVGGPPRGDVGCCCCCCCLWYCSCCCVCCVAVLGVAPLGRVTGTKEGWDAELAGKWAGKGGAEGKGVGMVVGVEVGTGVGVVAGVEVGEEEEEEREGLEPEGLMSLLVLGTMCGTESGRWRSGEGVVVPVFLTPPSLLGPVVVVSTATLLGSRVTMVMVLGGEVGVVGVVTTVGVVREAEERVLGGAKGMSSSSSVSRTLDLWVVAGVEGGLGAGLAFLGGTGGGGMTSSLRQTRGEAPGDISGLRDP